MSHTNSGELAPHMDDHDNRHDQSADVRYTRGTFIDESIGHIDSPAIALRQYSGLPCQGACRPH